VGSVQPGHVMGAFGGPAGRVKVEQATSQGKHMGETTILHHLERHAAERPHEPAIHDKVAGVWRSTSWRNYNNQTRAAAKSLLAKGVGEGDVVAILSANRPEWVVAALGAMRVGGISAGIYATCSAEEIGYVLNHSEAPIVVVEKPEQLERVLETWPSVPTLKTVVMLNESTTSDDPRVISWQSFVELGEGVDDAQVDAALASLRSDQVADFIYTSGTTGPPKAVMLTHENLEWTASTMGGLVDMGPADVSLSYLPLSHIAEQSASILMPLVYGSQVFFCHEGLQVAEYLKAVRPTTFFGVPRVWERFEAGIKAQLAETTGVKAKLVDGAMATSLKYHTEANAGRTPAKLLDAQFQAASKVILSKIHAAVGFDRCRLYVSGAAPVQTSTIEFLTSVGMPIVELYGQSEGSGPTSTNLPGANKHGTVGPAIPGVEVKIADDGEILLRGKNVFAGYSKNPEATAETIIDGWLHSGDLGSLDSQGYLSIVGRKKDIIITSGGKNIAPQNIEEALMGIDIVSGAVVCGEQQRFLIALLTLEPEAAGRYAEEHGFDLGTLHENSAVREHLSDAILSDVNPLMARVEHVRNFAVLPHDFSAETGELTPTFKIKRNVVNEKYAAIIDATFADGQLL